MNNNKLAVIFPGIGYHSDKPLLYYSKKVAKSDPWCDTTLVDEKCAELGLGLYKYENANHSIETGAVIKDIDNIRKIMEEVECFLK